MKKENIFFNDVSEIGATHEPIEHFATGKRITPQPSATSVIEGTIAFSDDGDLCYTKKDKNGVGRWFSAGLKFNFNDLSSFKLKQTWSGNKGDYNGQVHIEFSTRNDLDPVRIDFEISRILSEELDLNYVFDANFYELYARQGNTIFGELSSTKPQDVYAWIDKLEKYLKANYNAWQSGATLKGVENDIYKLQMLVSTIGNDLSSKFPMNSALKQNMGSQKQTTPPPSEFKVGDYVTEKINPYSYSTIDTVFQVTEVDYDNVHGWLYQLSKNGSGGSGNVRPKDLKSIDFEMYVMDTKEIKQLIIKESYTLAEFLNTRIEVSQPEMSMNFQELIMALGGSWEGFSMNLTNITETYLYVDDFGFMSYNESYPVFVKSNNTLLRYTDIFKNKVSATSTNPQATATSPQNYGVLSAEEFFKKTLEKYKLNAIPTPDQFLEALKSKRRSKAQKLIISQAFGEFSIILKKGTDWDSFIQASKEWLNITPTEDRYFYYKIRPELSSLISEKQLGQFTDKSKDQWNADNVFTYFFENKINDPQIQDEWFKAYAEFYNDNVRGGRVVNTPITPTATQTTNNSQTSEEYLPLELINLLNYEISNFYETKIVVDTPEKSSKFQEFILAMGGSWGNDEREVQYTDAHYLFVSDSGILTFVFNEQQKDYFDNNPNRLIDYNELFVKPNSQVVQVVQETVVANKIVHNSIVPNKTYQELEAEYSDLMFLISVTPTIDFAEMSSLKQQARELKEQIDASALIIKDEMLKENNIFDELFTASAIQPKHRYNLTPDQNGFAPDGTQTQLPKRIYEFTLTEEFERWFGNFQMAYQFRNSPFTEVPCSVVKNVHYEPQIVFHGTGDEFSFFDFSRFPIMYFAENYFYAEWFAQMKGQQNGHEGYIYPFFLNIKNPLDLTHFGIEEITGQEFADWLYLQTGLEADELKINPALLTSTIPTYAWVYLRNGEEMLKVLRDTKLFDGIVYYEQNPPINPTAPNYKTKGFIIFEPQSAKIVDPERHNLLLPSMRSFYLKKGGKL